MKSTERETGEETGRVMACRARAEGYDRYLATLRRKLATYQGGYLEAVQREAEEIHCRWLLANQELFAAELAIR